MERIIHAARAALVVAAVVALAGSVAGAQTQRLNHGVAAGTMPGPRTGPPTPPYPGGRIGEPERSGPDWQGRYRRNRNDGGMTVIYLPANGENGYYPQQPGIFYPQDGIYAAPGVYSSQVVVGRGIYTSSGGGMGMVYDASGRPVTPSYGLAAGAGYTPDLSGSPYVVVADGVMLADMPNGEQRAFASCATQTAQRDPAGKPRTIFFTPTTYGLLLREGQQGRVQGTPPPATKACYGIDRVGRVALLY